MCQRWQHSRSGAVLPTQQARLSLVKSTQYNKSTNLPCNDFLAFDPQSLRSAKTGVSNCSNAAADAMVVPFGFSIGDFIDVATLFKDIVVALKDYGGAASDYQNTVKKLETIEAVLLSLKDFKSNGASLGQINAIRTQANSFGQDIGLFLKGIHRYEQHLGCHSTRGFRHGAYSKIKWAQHVSKAVSKLDGSIAFHVSILQTLLGMHTIDALSAAVLSQQCIKDLVTTQAAGNTQMLAKIGSQLRSSHEDIQQDLRSVLVLIISEIQDLDTRLGSRTRPSSLPAPVSSHASVNTGATSSSGSLRMCADADNQSTAATNNHGPKLALTRAHPRFSRDQMNDICNVLVTEIETIFRLVIAFALVALQDFLVLFPQVLFIARMMQVLPRAISLIRQDCIRFEDALGRIQNLQYQHFRSWKIFEAMVHCNFEGVQGRRKILRGQYTLTCPRLPGQQLAAASWGQQVFPGMTVVMAINIKAFGISGASCPKCSSSNTSSCSAIGSRCHSCDLVFSRSFVTNIAFADPSHSGNRKPNYLAGERDLERLDNNIRWWRTQNSEGSGGHVEESHDNVPSRSGASSEVVDDKSTNPDDEPSDSEDETENLLKVFKRVNLLQGRKKKVQKRSTGVSSETNKWHLAASASAFGVPQRPADSEAADIKSAGVKTGVSEFGYPLLRVIAQVPYGPPHFTLGKRSSDSQEPSTPPSHAVLLPVLASSEKEISHHDNHSKTISEAERISYLKDRKRSRRWLPGRRMKE